MRRQISFFILYALTIGGFGLPSKLTDPGPPPKPVAAIKASTTMAATKTMMMSSAVPSAAATMINGNTATIGATSNASVTLIGHSTSSKCMCPGWSSSTSNSDSSSNSNNDVNNLSSNTSSNDAARMFSTMMTCASTTDSSSPPNESSAFSDTSSSGSVWSCGTISSSAAMMDWSAYVMPADASCSPNDAYTGDQSPDSSYDSSGDGSSDRSSDGSSFTYDSSSSDGSSESSGSDSSYDSSSNGKSSSYAYSSCNAVQSADKSINSPTGMGAVKVLTNNDCNRKVLQTKSQITTVAIVQIFAGRQTTAIVVAQTVLILKTGEIQTRFSQILIQTTFLEAFQTKWSSNPSWMGMDSSEFSASNSWPESTTGSSDSSYSPDSSDGSDSSYDGDSQ